MTLKFLLIAGSALVALAGCASTAPHRTAATVADQHKSACVTASHLPPRSAPCVAGRSWSGEELESTGEIDPADALQKLDPTITVQHR